ncbi:hypothetical protein [Oceanirhabdus sp. W0125-5]|uniref:hypothetical protein n=1 Tax=Oceanirhabdus sp. W0125-5 TaxID=2999116 RepID=UPI0022F2B9E0|nr:hypothetical protein [Oceanirhabdus sp. W0125-5]WBW96378.1 hypothetical protein OW730_22185 [Oceanirhabdus sp. W0125-5]
MKKALIIFLIFIFSILCVSEKITEKKYTISPLSHKNNITHIMKNSYPEYIEEKIVTKDNLSSEKPNNTPFEIKKITLKNYVNTIGRNDYDIPLDVEYSGERTTFFGERLYLKIELSQEINCTNYKQIIICANPYIELNTNIHKKYNNILIIAIDHPIEDNTVKEFDVVVPKKLISNYGDTLAQDTIIKLKANPHLSVKVVSNTKNFPFSKDKELNIYSTKVKKNMSYSFSLIFNGSVNRETVLQCVRSALGDINPKFDWVSDRELKVSFGSIKERIDSKINLSTALDANGNRIYSTVLIVIEPDKELDFNISNLMPYKKGFTWHYKGTLNYNSYEEIEKVDRKPDKKTITVHGKLETLYKKTKEDSTYTKIFTVTKNSLDLTYKNVTIPLLKGPIEYDNKWSHDWYDNKKGETKIVKILDDSIITETTIFEGSSCLKKIRTIYKMGSGIKNIKYFNNDTIPHTAEIWLNITYNDYSNSRYY